MITSGGMSKVANYYKNAAQMQKKSEAVTKGGEQSEALKAVEKKAAQVAEKNAERKKAAEKMVAENKISSSEDKLSDRAKAYLDKLRKMYGDYDFIVADRTDDKRGLVDQSNKEFSILFTSAELEKMASDEEYAQEKLGRMETAVNMSKRICEEFGFESAWNQAGNGSGWLKKLAISFNEEGELSIFSELEKVNEKQRERIKRAMVEASSTEELQAKIAGIDWDKIPEEVIASGANIDFSV